MKCAAIVCVISAGLGLVVLLVSYLSSQECGRLNRDLSTPHNSLTYLATSVWWLLSSTFISVFSSLLLCSLLYVDSLTLTRPTWLILPVVVLGLAPLLQSLLYHLLVKEGCEHRFAWGVFAAVTPVRFLETESRKTVVFLVWSQVSWLLSHSLAWLLYCVYSVLTDEADTLFRVWLPIIMPLLLIPPLTAGLHWALSLSPLYTSRHAHPDMTRPDKRTLSFPPDWPQLAGTSLAPDSLARAGFFYSCRRLNTSEATCFSCGRQVTDWTNVKTAEMARMCSEHCPLYTESKPAPPPEPLRRANNVSCFAEFLFIASTMLFRIASICLLLWVFMVRNVESDRTQTVLLIRTRSSGPVDLSGSQPADSRHHSSPVFVRSDPVQHDHLLHLSGQHFLLQLVVGAALGVAAETCQVFAQLGQTVVGGEHFLQPAASRLPVGRTDWGLHLLLPLSQPAQTGGGLACPAGARPPLRPPESPLLFPHSQTPA